jgi:hypothetical protein
MQRETLLRRAGISVNKCKTPAEMPGFLFAFLGEFVAKDHSRQPGLLRLLLLTTYRNAISKGGILSPE